MEIGNEEQGKAEWLTVAQAAERLAVSEKSIRNWAKRPGYFGDGLTRNVERGTQTGKRSALEVSALWVALVRGAVANPPERRNAEQGTVKPAAVTFSVPCSVEVLPAPPVQSGERDALIAEKDARISDLKAANDDLRVKLDQALKLVDQEQQLRLAAEVRERLAIEAANADVAEGDDTATSSKKLSGAPGGNGGPGRAGMSIKVGRPQWITQQEMVS